MSSDTQAHSAMMSDSMKEEAQPMNTNMAAESAVDHMLAADDPDNPMKWPLYKKVYTSATSSALTWVVAFGATAYSTGLTGVQERFGVSMTVSILPYSLYFWGIAFAPIITPHLSERFGRQMVYMTIYPIFLIFLLGAGFTRTFRSLVVTRFFAGFFGGPCLVLIEGTFADMWSADFTVAYYGFLTLASFTGASSGPLIGFFLTAYGGWRWTEWIIIILGVGAYLFAIGMPDTYPREILRRRARRLGQPANLLKAQSGVTFAEMASITFVRPLIMLFTEPLVIISSLYVGLIFAVIFQFFISVPVVLETTYNFTPQHAGIAFTGAVTGSILATLTSALIDWLSSPHLPTRLHDGKVPEEYRMLPAMLGGGLITTSLFWIAWTAKPSIHYLSPIFGTLVFIWGSQLVLTSIIAYLFDAYPPRETLSALTAAACFRLVMAGLIPMVIIQMIKALTGGWAFSTFAFISAALWPLIFVIFFFGGRLRAWSPYNPQLEVHMLKLSSSRDEEANVMVHNGH